MKKIVAYGAGVLIVAGALAGSIVLLSSSRDKDNARQRPQQTENTTQAPASTDSSATDQRESPPENTSQVTIQNFSYTPQNISIKRGTTVTWTNNDSTEHDVMPDDGSSDNFQSSQLLARGESYSFTFNEPGTYAYHCTPHPHMTGVVTVTE